MSTTGGWIRSGFMQGLAWIGGCGTGAGGLRKRLAFVRVGSEGEPIERASASRAEDDDAWLVQSSDEGFDVGPVQGRTIDDTPL